MLGALGGPGTSCIWCRIGYDVFMTTPPQQSPVYRAPLWSRDDAVDREAAVAWALRHGVVAVGGRLDEVPADLDDAVDLVRRAHGPRLAARLARFAAVEDGAFVWTWSSALGPRVGRVDGGWRFDGSEGARVADLQHTRPCTWHDEEVPADQVPADVAVTFARGGRNFQRTRSTSAEVATATWWDEHAVGT